MQGSTTGLLSGVGLARTGQYWASKSSALLSGVEGSAGLHWPTVRSTGQYRAVQGSTGQLSARGSS